MDLFNVDYEKCLLSALIQDNDIAEIAVPRINSEWFYDLKNQKIFHEIATQIRDTKVCNIVTLNAVLPSNFAPYLVEVAGSNFTGSTWEFYAEEIEKYYKTREMKKVLGEVNENLNVLNVNDSISEIDNFITKSLSHSETSNTDIHSLVNDLLNMVETNSKVTSKYLGYDTGWDNLSDILDGLELGKLVVVGARPSIGKSAFALQLASQLCSRKVPCAYFSLEMSRLSLMTRLASLESGIPIYFIKHAMSTNSNFYVKLNKALEKIWEYDLSINDKRLRNEQKLYSEIRYLAKKQGKKVFFVDHIGLVPHSNPMMKKVEQLDDITRNLLELAQELNVTIIILCQLKRDSEGKKPTLSDLRDSGAIEQNADICMFLHRERATGNENEIPSEVIVIKNRDGNCGTAEMMFIPQQTRFNAVIKQQAV